MNAVVMIAYNQTAEQLQLTKDAVASVFTQDVAVELWLLDNGSTPETAEWMRGLEAPEGHRIEKQYYRENQSPVMLSNRTMATMFSLGHECVFGVPNDVTLPENCLSEMLKCPRGLVAAWMNGEREYKRVESATVVHEDCHLSVAMVRHWCFQAVVSRFGDFLGSKYFLYASDVDLKLRLAVLGIHGAQLDIECWHFGSASWRLAPPVEAAKTHRQADIDRGTFAATWGFGIGSPEHLAALASINFRGEAL